MNATVLAAKIEAFLGYKVSCAFKEEESQWIVEIFAVPQVLKKQVRHKLYGLESTLFPAGDVFISAIAYDEEETREYFPEIYAEITNPPPPPAPVVEAVYNNATPEDLEIICPDLMEAA